MSAWYKLIINTEAKAEELLASLLHTEGTKGIEIVQSGKDEKIRIISYFDFKPDENLIRGKAENSLKAVFNQPIMFETGTEEAEDKDWVKAQADSLGIVKITDRIWIIPPWKKEYIENDAAGKTYILLNPGSAFGTGEHPTTRGCIEALEKYIHKGDTVLDVGAGSGILGIAALKFGACRVSAIEIDPNASSNGIENFQMNGFSDKMDWHTGTVRTYLVKEKFNIIAANIFSHIILNDADWMLRFGKKETIYIFSGILFEGSSDFLSEMSEKGFSLLDTFRIGEWMTFVMENKY